MTTTRVQAIRLQPQVRMIISAMPSARSSLAMLGLLLSLPLAAADLVTYAGGTGKERFHCVHALSDGTLLMGGTAQTLAWIPGGTPTTAMAATGITSTATGQVAFLLHLSGDATSLLRVVHFPAGSARSVFRIRSSEVPGSATGTLIISGHSDGATPGYYIARLNGNFVTAPPTGITWAYNAACGAGSAYQNIQPWDVGGDGSVICGEGTEYDYNWAAVYRLDAATGKRTTMAGWPAHWPAAGSVPAYSAVVLKAGREGSLRSTTQADYDLLQSDENGNPGRKGRFPDDYYFSGPLPAASGPGYTGYRTSDRPTQRLGGVVIDRRTGDHYLGYSTQTRLPGGNPDFEPAVVALTASGTLKWWTRLYRETSSNSTPDQYVDGLALDYSTAKPHLVVLARAHGNNTDNFWRGHEITASPGANGFQNQFTGTNGNIHLSWIGRLRDDTTSATLVAATWQGEYAEDATFGGAYSDPNLDGWPDKNAGWPKLNTTRMQENALRVDAAGRVYVIGAGRKTITTANAFQRMAHPRRGGTVGAGATTTTFSAATLIGKGPFDPAIATVTFTSGANNGQVRGIAGFDAASGTVTLASAVGNAPVTGDSFRIYEGKSCWNQFVRVYTPDLSSTTYSSLIVGNWNRATEAGGSNTDLDDVLPVDGGVLSVGWHTASAGTANGVAIPTVDVPTWGGAAPTDESAILARLSFTTTPPPPGPGTLRLAGATANVGEQAGSWTISVTRHGGTLGAASVAYATANGSAGAADFTASTGTFTWADGEGGTRTAVVAIANDSAYEGDEAFSVSLSGATGAALGAPATTTVTISDDDLPPGGLLTVTAATMTVGENAGSATIGVARTGGSGAVSVGWNAGGGTANPGGDYTAGSGTLDWAAGDTATKTITIPLIDDTGSEGTETFLVTLSGPTGGAALGTPSHCTVSISDNDGGGGAPSGGGGSSGGGCGLGSGLAALLSLAGLAFVALRRR